MFCKTRDKGHCDFSFPSARHVGVLARARARRVSSLSPAPPPTEPISSSSPVTSPSFSFARDPDPPAVQTVAAPLRSGSARPTPSPSRTPSPSSGSASLLRFLASDPIKHAPLVAAVGDLPSLVSAAVSLLATASDASHCAVFEEGVLGPLFRLVDSGPLAVRDRAAAAAVIETITADPANAWAISVYDGVPILIAACRSEFGSPAVQTLAAPPRFGSARPTPSPSRTPSPSFCFARDPDPPPFRPSPLHRAPDLPIRPRCLPEPPLRRPVRPPSVPNPSSYVKMAC